MVHSLRANVSLQLQALTEVEERRYSLFPATAEARLTRCERAQMKRYLASVLMAALGVFAIDSGESTTATDMKTKTSLGVGAGPALLVCGCGAVNLSELEQKSVPPATICDERKTPATCSTPTCSDTEPSQYLPFFERTDP